MAAVRFEKLLIGLVIFIVCVCVCFPFACIFSIFYFILLRTFVLFIILNLIYTSNSIEIEVLCTTVHDTKIDKLILLYTHTHARARKCVAFFLFLTVYVSIRLALAFSKL